MRVRLAKSADLEAVCSTDSLAASDTRRRDRLIRGIHTEEVWVVELDGAIAGYGLMARSFFDRDFIELVIVDPRYRGRGLGPALIRQLEAACTQAQLFTSTNESNAHMRHVLEKLGYRPSGIIHNLDPGDPEIVYVKGLEGAK